MASLASKLEATASKGTGLLASKFFELLLGNPFSNQISGQDQLPVEQFGQTAWLRYLSAVDGRWLTNRFQV